MATTTTTIATTVRSPSTSSTSSNASSAGTRPRLRLTTQDLDDTSTSKPTTRYYAHLLYVDTPQRERIMARSVSSASSVRSNASTRSQPSSHSSTAPTQPTCRAPVTPAARSGLTPLNSPTYIDEHYPLISSISPAAVPSHIPPTHPAFHCASHMAQIHNLLIRALNSIYNHSLRVDPAIDSTNTTANETADFLHFCRVWCALLNHHHEIEDTWLFPEFEKLLSIPGAMGSNVAGHDAFLPGLRLFEAYVSRTAPAEYCGMTLRNMLDRFAPLLVEHLHDEIPTMLAMWRVEAEPLRKVWAVAEKMGRSGGSVWEAPAMILGCVDRAMLMDGALCTFPEVPWAVEKVVRKGLARRFAGVWRFAPFDFEGRRRTIPGGNAGR